MKLKTHLPAVSSRSTTVGAFAGITIAFLVSLILVAAITGLIMGNKLSEKSLSWVVFAVQFVAVLSGTLIGTGLSKEKYIATAGIVVGGYLTLLLGLGIIIYDGTLKNWGAAFVSVIAGGVIGYLIRLKSQNKPRRSRKINV